MSQGNPAYWESAGLGEAGLRSGGAAAPGGAAEGGLGGESGVFGPDSVEQFLDGEYLDAGVVGVGVVLRGVEPGWRWLRLPWDRWAVGG